MAKQLNVDLNIRANTKLAQEALNSLSKNLLNILNIKNMPIIADESYKSAASAAKTLERNLQAAVNVDTGKLDLNKFSMSLKKSNTSITELAMKLSGAGATGQEAFLNLAKSIALADNSALSLGTKLGGLMTTLKNTARWQISSSILHGFMGAIQGAYGYALDLNESLNNIRIITGLNIDLMASFAKEANNAAKALSTTTTEYTNASLIYYQLGLSDEDVKARTNATIKMANVTKLSADEVSSLMTAIWNNFAKGSENLEYYEDVVTKLGATTASSSKEILDGLLQFAAVADTVDLSYEKASAALATVVAETRQSADTVGTAFKTLFARVEGLKLGETLDDGTDLNKYSKALATVGVNIKDLSGQLKDMDAILDDIGSKWQTLSKDQLVALALTVAGVRQYTLFVALMDNYDKVLKNEKTAKSSSGTIDEQHERYAEGWEAARDRVKAAAEDIYLSLLNDKTFIDALNGFEKVLGFIDNVIDGLGGLKGILLLIGSIFMLQYAREMPKFLETISQNLMIITGQGEKVKLNMLDEVQASLALDRSSMANFNKANGSYEMQAKYEATQKAVEMTQKLNASMKLLSESEKEEALAKIALITQEGEYLALLGKEIDIEEKKIKSSVNQASKNAMATLKDSSQLTKTQLTKKGYDLNLFDFDEERLSFDEALSFTKEAKYQERDNQILLRAKNRSLGSKEGALTKLINDLPQDDEKRTLLLEEQKNIIDLIKQNRIAIEESKKREQEYDLIIKGLNESLLKTELLINGEFKSIAGNAKILSDETNNINIRTKNWENAYEKINKLQNGSISQLKISKKMTAELANEMQGYANYIQKSVSAMENSKDLTDVEKKSFKELKQQALLFSDDIEAAKNGTKQWSDVFNSLKNGGDFFTSLNTAAGETEIALDLIKRKLKEAGLEDPVIDALADSFGILAEKTLLYKAGLDGISQKSSENLERTVKMSEALSSFGSILMQVSMAYNAIKNIGSIWDDEELSTGEKVLLTMTAIGTLIPTLIGVYRGLKTIKDAHIITTIKDTAANVANTYAKISELAATEGVTVAQWALNAAMEANPIGAIIAAIVALVAVLAVLVTALMAAANAESEEEKAVKKANEALEDAKKAAEEAKQAYEDLKSSVSSYEDAVEALKKCTKGTQEWRDAFREVLALANELIEKYPELLSYGNLFDKNGLINQDALDKILEKAENSADAAANTVIEKQSELALANYNKTKKDIIEDAAEKASKDAKEENNSITATSNGSSVSLEQITEKVVNNLGDKIATNYTDSDEIRRLVVAELSDKYHFSSGDLLNKAADQITSSIGTVNHNFQNLSNETDSVVNEFINARKALTANFYPEGEEITPAMELGVAKARQEYQGRVESEYSKGKEYFLNVSDYSFADDYSTLENNFWGEGEPKEYGTKEYKERAKQFIDDYLKLHPELKLLDEKNLTDWEDNVLRIMFTDTSKGENSKTPVTIDQVYSELVSNGVKIYESDIQKEGKEYAESYKEKGYSDAILRYMNDLNFANADYDAVKDLQNLSEKDILTEMFGENYNDDIIAKHLSIVLNQSVDEIKEGGWVDKFKAGLTTGINNTIELTTEAIPDFIGNQMDKIKGASGLELIDISKMYSKAFAKTGNTDILDRIVNVAGEENGKVLTELSKLDLSNIGVEEANQALANANILFKLSAEEFYSLRDVLKDTSAVTTEAARETYKETSKILDKIKSEGDIVEDKDYEKLLALNPAISSFFTTLADGTHMLTGEVRDFKTAIQSAQIDLLYQAQLNAGRTVWAYDLLKNSSNNDVNQVSNIDEYKGSKAEERLMALIQAMRDQGETDKAEEYEANLLDALNKEDKTVGLKKLNEILENGEARWKSYEVSVEEADAKIQKAEEDVSELTEAIKEQKYQNEIANAGLDYETTENYADVLMEIYEAQGLSKEAARELAIANQRLDNGLSSLNDNFETWSKSLKNTSKASVEYAKTIGEIRIAFADLLNIADANELSSNWIKSWINNGDKLAKIMDGDTEALLEFRESAFAEMTSNVFDDIKTSAQDLLDTLDDPESDRFEALLSLINQLDEGTISAEGLKQELDSISDNAIGGEISLSDDYTNALNEMLKQGLLTEQLLNDIFASIGYKPKVHTEYVDLVVRMPNYNTIETIQEEDLASPEGTTGRRYSRTISTETVPGDPPYKDMHLSVPVVLIDGSGKNNGNLEVVNAGSVNITPSYNSTTSGKKSNSNSSSSNKTPTTKAASHNHEINRYTAEENAIDGLAKQYEKLNNIKDKSFGKGKIQAIENEIKALKELKLASTNYMDAIVGDGNGKKIAEAIYRGENIGDLLRNGAISGNLGSDYRALNYGISASGKLVEYTAKDEAGNEWLASRDYDINDFNAMFGTNIHFDLDAFGNIQNVDSIRNLLQLLRNNESDAYSSIADPTADSTTRYNERVAYIDEILDRMDTFGDSINTLSEQSEEYLDYITLLQEKNAELITSKMELGVELGDKSLRRIDRALKVLGNDIYRSAEAMAKAFELNDQKIESTLEKALSYQEMMNEAERRFALYQENPLNEDAITPAEYAEMLSTAEEGFESIADEMREYMNYFYDMYSGIQDYWEEKISRITKQMEDSIKVLEYYQKALELTGRSGDYELIGKILEGQAETAKTIFETSQARAELAKKEWERQKDDLEKAKLDPTLSKDLLDTLENMTELAYEKYVEAVETAREDSLNYLEITQTAFENRIKQMRVESEKFLTNGSDFDSLNKSMERQKSLSEDYLTKTNLLYETNKMLRQLNQDIDKTDSVIAKNKLKAFADEISAMQDQEKLSNTSLEIAKAKYEILLAQIALEDAQNAKSTVLLRRDSEGNYGYVYTADEEAVNNALQNLEDKVNALYNLGKKASEDFAEKMILLEQEEWAEIEEIANNTILTTDEKNLKIAELLEYYNAKRQALSEQYEEANLALQQGAIAQRLLITDKFNTENLDIEKVAAEARAEAWTESFTTTIKDLNTYEAHFKLLASQLKSEMLKLDDKRELHEQATKTGNKEIERSVEDITEAVDDLSYEILKRDGLLDSYSAALSASDALRDSFKRLYETAKNLATEYSNAADRASNLYVKTVDLINALVALNHANNGATYLEWGPDGVTADYNGNTVSTGGGGSNSGNLSFNNNSNEDSNKNSKCPPHDYIYLWTTWNYNPGNRTGAWLAVMHYKCRYCGKIKDITSPGYYNDNKGGNYRFPVNLDNINRYKTGGYTGSWNGPDIEENGKLAFLHQKELVLNADDTENMLNAVKLIRLISESIDLLAAVLSSYSIGAILFPGNNQVLLQEVTIHAEFPNATDHNEIEEAFNSLVNRASQYANRS